MRPPGPPPRPSSTARAAELAIAARAPADAAAHLRRALDALTVAAPGDRVRRQQLSTELGIAPPPAVTRWVGGLRWSRRRPWPTRSATSTASWGAMRHVNGDDLWSSLDWSQVDDAATVAVIERNLDRLPADRSASAPS